MDDDLDEELLLLAGRGKTAGKKRARQGSDSEEEPGSDAAFSDEDYDEPARPKKGSAPAKKRKGKPAAQQAEEPDSDDEGSELDEAEMAGLTELEREMLIFEREEKRERARERKQLVKQARKDAEQPVEVRASSRRAKATTGTENAIGKLAAARQQRQQRVQQKEQEKEQQEEEEREAGGVWDEEQELSSDEAPLEEEGDEEEEGAYRETRGGYRTERYDDASDEEDALIEPAEMADLLTIQLKRSRLEAWHREPFFEESVRGCVVRIVHGTYMDDKGNQHGNYHLMKISDIREKGSYSFGGVRTSKWLVLEDQGVTQSLQMSLVSNSPFTEEEFQRYLRHCDRGGSRPLSKGEVEDAKRRLRAAHSYKYTREDIKRRLDEKREKGQVVGSYASEKARLEILLAQAQAQQDEEATERYTLQLEDLERRKASRPADASKSDMSHVNLRNRKANVQKALDNVSNRPTFDNKERAGPDLFSRRQTRSSVYWNTKGNRAAEEGAADGAAAAKAPAAVAAAVAPAQQPPAASEKLKPGLARMDPAELLQLLDIDIDESLLPRIASEADGASRIARRMLGPRWHKTIAARPDGDLAHKTVVSFDAWKKKLGVGGH